jgi:long-chain acyl-CoA synthetase
MANTAEAAAVQTMNDIPAPIFDGRQWVWEKHYPEDVSWKNAMPKKPLFHVIDHAVMTYPDHTLCHFLGRDYSYKHMGDMVNRVAAGLQKMGVTKGVKVGLFLPNTPYSIMFFYGILKAGGTVVNYNPLYVERELQGQIEDSETDIMITTDLKALCDKMDNVLKTTRLKHVIVCPFAGALPFIKGKIFGMAKAKDIAKITYGGKYVAFKDVVANDGKFDLPVIDAEEDVAVLQYTGGTTGIPKGAMLTHANLFANMMQIVTWVNTIEHGKDSMVGVLPLFHVFAMTVVMNCSMWMGLKIILLPKFDLAQMFDVIKKLKPTMLPAVPAIFNAIASSPDVGKHDFSCLKFCISGGAPLPLDVKRLFEEKTGSRTIAEGYGLTEASPGCTFNPARGTRKPGSVGMPVPDSIVEIISREDGTTLLGVGEKGEVCIKGPHVMKGYYNKPDATDEVIRNGRLHTGDVGYLDEQGYLYLVDRIKDLIIVRGYNVYPRIVEEAIYQHPAVEECIVAGVPDAERGETVRAWVKPVAGKTLTQEELLHFLGDKISPIEMPRQIAIREKALPKTAVGKLSRKDLLEQEGIKK